MTDELMDARLRTAGESWRAANTSAAEIGTAPAEPLDLGVGQPRHRARWLTAASAAIVAAALILGGLVLARSGGDDKRAPAVGVSPRSELFGVTWKDPGSSGTVVFSAGTARTFDGCKNELYRLSFNDDRLSVGRPMAPSSVCTGTATVPGAPDPAAARLAKFYKVLRGPSHWSVTGKSLALTAASGATIILMTDGKPAPMLVGTRWVLDRVSTDSELPGSYSSATLSIDSSGHFTANDLCNALSGTARTTANAVDFGSVASTAKACIDPGFTPATTVIDAVLNGKATYAIRGNELILDDAGSHHTLMYVPAAPKTTKYELALLTSKPWTLTGTETTRTSAGTSSGGGSSAISKTVLQFDGDNGFTVRHRCYTNAGKAGLGKGTIDFSDVTLKTAKPCPSDPDTATEQRENDFVDALLTGQVTWSIAGVELTITKADGHSATFS